MKGWLEGLFRRRQPLWKRSTERSSLRTPGACPVPQDLDGHSGSPLDSWNHYTRPEVLHRPAWRPRVIDADIVRRTVEAGVDIVSEWRAGKVELLPPMSSTV